MTPKKLIGQIHLWIGLVVGILFFVIAASGAILVWQPEFRYLLFDQGVAPQDQNFVLPSDLRETMDREFPQGDYRTAFFREKEKTCEVLLYGQGTYYIAQLNPYTAELIHLQDMNTGFISFMVKLHRNLLMKDFGREVVHWVTLLFLLMLITGLVIWWPSSKRERKGRLMIKWGASPKKLNYDFHNVLGFYATWIAIFTVVTGLFWGFDLVKNSMKAVTGESGVTYEQPRSDTLSTAVYTNPFDIMDSLTIVFRERFPDKTLRISNPHGKQDVIRVNINDPEMLVSTGYHYYFDRYTGKEITGHFMHGPGEQLSAYEKLHGLVYDVHFGTIAGLTGRLLVFFSSLIAASLPITGFIYWLGRKKK
ncbi:MAG: PepSY-associated TM helix domain-containing protein [Cyclobacteriaceae bacterium]